MQIAFFLIKNTKFPFRNFSFAKSVAGVCVCECVCLCAIICKHLPPPPKNIEKVEIEPNDTEIFGKKGKQKKEIENDRLRIFSMMHNENGDNLETVF